MNVHRRERWRADLRERRRREWRTRGGSPALHGCARSRGHAGRTGRHGIAGGPGARHRARAGVWSPNPLCVERDGATPHGSASAARLFGPGTWCERRSRYLDRSALLQTVRTAVSAFSATRECPAPWGDRRPASHREAGGYVVRRRPSRSWRAPSSCLGRAVAVTAGIIGESAPRAGGSRFLEASRD